MGRDSARIKAQNHGSLWKPGETKLHDWEGKRSDYWKGVSRKLNENSKKFFGTFMPLVSSKSTGDKDLTDISLNSQGQLQQDRQIVAEEFTRYFSTVADNIGGFEAACLTENKCYSHPGEIAMRNKHMSNSFNFKSISRRESSGCPTQHRSSQSNRMWPLSP